MAAADFGSSKKFAGQQKRRFFRQKETPGQDAPYAQEPMRSLSRRKAAAISLKAGLLA